MHKARILDPVRLRFGDWKNHPLAKILPSRECNINPVAAGARCQPDEIGAGCKTRRRVDRHSPVFRNKSRAKCQDRKSTRLNSSHDQISYAVFCLKKKKKKKT